MESDFNSERPDSYQVLASRSWTSYVGTALRNGFVAIVALSFALGGSGIGLFVLVLALSRLTYMIFWHRSHILYRDDMGVWLARGLLPWSKGLVGVKWRDLDEAVYHQNLLSWLTKSYTIRIGHRFTKGAEIVLDHAQFGNDAVVLINQSHADMIRANALA